MKIFQNKKILTISIIAGLILIIGPFVVIASIEEADTLDGIYISKEDIENLREQTLSDNDIHQDDPAREEQKQQVENLLKENSLSDMMFNQQKQQTDNTSTETQQRLNNPPIDRQIQPVDYQTDDDYSTPNSPDSHANNIEHSIPNWGSDNSNENHFSNEGSTVISQNAPSLQVNQFSNSQQNNNIGNRNQNPNAENRHNSHISAQPRHQNNPQEDRGQGYQRWTPFLDKYTTPETEEEYPILPEQVEVTNRTHSSVAFNLLSPENPLVRDYIQKYSTEGKQQLQYSYELLKTYYSIIQSQVNQHELPDELSFLPLALSGYNPDFKSQDDSYGLWQLRSYLAKAYDLNITPEIDERKDPFISSTAALKYIKTTEKVYDDYNLAIASLLAGSGYVIEKTEEMGTTNIEELIVDRNFRVKTNDVIPRFHALLHLIKHADHYGVARLDLNTIPVYGKVNAPTNMNLSQIASKLDMSLDTIKRLNPHLISAKTPMNLSSVSLIIPRQKYHLARLFQSDNTEGNYNPPPSIDAAVDPDPYDPWLSGRSHLLAAAESPSSNNTEHYAPILPPQSDPLLDVPVDHNRIAQLNRNQDSSYIRYTVRSGDTLTQIARRFNVSIQHLANFNNMNNLNDLQIGETILVPQNSQSNQFTENDVTEMVAERSQNRTSIVYRIQKGDSLIKIADRYDVRLGDIFSANQGLSQYIREGQEIRIPDAQISRNE